jgi:hypothetical protein
MGDVDMNVCKVCEENEGANGICENCGKKLSEKKAMAKNDRNITLRQIFTFDGINYLLEVGWDIVHDQQETNRPHLIQSQDLTITER